MRSSSVRRTSTRTGAPSGEISGALAALRSASTAMPMKPSPSQIRALSERAFSPMPAVKISASIPPSAAASAAISRRPR